MTVYDNKSLQGIAYALQDALDKQGIELTSWQLLEAVKEVMPSYIISHESFVQKAFVVNLLDAWRKDIKGFSVDAYCAEIIKALGRADIMEPGEKP